MRNRGTLKSLSLAIFSLFVVFASYAQPTPPAGKTWEVVPALTDEFDSFDGVKWYKELWDYQTDTSLYPLIPVHMIEDNAGVSDGKLWIKATLAADTTVDRWFESSRIYSKTRISYPMYTECYMKANSISSYNTFWMNNGDANNRNEIDMCESNANPSMAGKEFKAYTLNSQYFVVKNGVTVRAADNFNSNNLSDSNPLQGVHWDDAYHTIGVWWKDAKNIQFYLNGEKAGSVVAAEDFTLSMNLIWDVWSQDVSWVGGLPQKVELNDDTKNTMYVDWVHTYTLKDDPTDIQEGDVKNADVYPNPAVDVLNIDLKVESEDATANIYNNVGQLVLSKQLEDVNNHFSVYELPSGIYIVQVLSGDSGSIQKVVIE